MDATRTTCAPVVAIAVAAVSLRVQAEPRLEVGSYGGVTSTTILQTFDCSSSSDTNDICVGYSEPHNGHTHNVSIGGYARYSVVPAVQLEANFAYARKGHGGASVLRMHYIEAPMVVRFDPVRDWSRARLFAYAGLAPALLVRCHATGMRFDNETRDAVPYDDRCGRWPFHPETPNRLDLGGVVGGGLGWELSFGIVELHARYIEGLIDNGAWGDGGKTVNKAFSVVAGYGRTIGKP